MILFVGFRSAQCIPQCIPNASHNAKYGLLFSTIYYIENVIHYSNTNARLTKLEIKYYPIRSY